MMCLMALSVVLAGYISCLIASHIHWHYGWISAPALLPGLTFGLVTAGWLLQRRWIGRGKAAGLVVGSVAAYFAAYWSAFYIVVSCGKGMVFSQSRLPLFHAGMIAGVIGTALLTASLAVFSADFRRKGWKTLIIIGTAAGGALCLAGVGAKSGDYAGTLGNPGDRAFISLWQLLVGGYIGVLLFGAPSFSSGPSERGRIAQWAPRTVLILLLASFIHAAIGFSRREKESRSDPNVANLDAALLSAATIAAAAGSPQASRSPTAVKQSDNAAGLAAMLSAAAMLEARSPTAQGSGSPQKSESSRPKETESAKKLREATEDFTVGRYAEALKLYDEAIALEPENPKGYLARGWALFCTDQKDAAVKDFDEAIKRNPKEAEAYFRRGLIHASASEHEKAAADFTKAIECRPDYAEAYYERGVSRAATNQFNQAREDFDHVIRLEAKNTLAYLNRGRALLELHETERALSDFNRAIELSGHDPAIFVGRGAAYVKLAKYEAAQKDLEQAILLNREFVPAYIQLAEAFAAQKNEAFAALNRGRAYFYSRQYSKATTEFERAAQLQPKLATMHLELGRSKSAQGITEIAAATAQAEPERVDIHEDEKIDATVRQVRDRFSKPAVESLKEAARLDPKNAEMQVELGRAYFYWDSASAIVAFEKAQQLDSKSAEPRFWLGVTKFTWGDEREVWKDGTKDEFRARLALNDLNAALELSPQHAGAYYFRASANHRLKQYDEAIADLGAAAEQASAAIHYLEYAAVLYSPNKRMMRSVERVPDELVAISLKVAALAQRAQCYCEKGRQDSALADSDQVVRTLPTDPRVFRLRAFVHNQAGNRAAEQADLRRAIQLALPASRDRRTATDYEACIEQSKHQLQLNPRDADAHIKLGDCYRGIGKYDLAQREYDQAIEVSPKAKALLDHSIEKEKARYCYAAIHDLDELTKIEPNNAALYYRKAKLYLMDHDTEDANPNFQRAAELDPTNREYAMRASHPATPSHQLTTEQLKDKLITAVVVTGLGALALGHMIDEANINDSKRVVEASGGTKNLCSRCGGRKRFLLAGSGPNPHTLGTFAYDDFEKNRTGTDFVPCGVCKGTGVVDAR
jgi:tetratricopeptide (TPR) repeat protein